MNGFYDITLNDYPRMEGETTDDARIQRAIADCESGVLYIPKGVYLIAEMITIKNCCSLLLHKSAVLKAVSEMQYVLYYDADVEVFVADEEGKEVMPGTLGEVCFKTPYVRGYMDASAGSGKRIEAGVFHTGDAGKKDAECILTVRGRIDEMFKIGGYRIEPDEVANAVKSVSGLSHVIVRGFVFKDISSVNVFYTGDIFVDPVEMREKLLTILPEYMIPTNYYRLSDFPYLSTGKVDKLKLLPPEGSWECFEELTGSGLRLIGEGRTAQVYDMGEHSRPSSW